MNLPWILRSLDPIRVRASLRRLRTYLSPVLFWSAVILPLLYIPFLAIGPETTPHVVMFVALLMLHILALLGSHSYTPR